MLRSGCASKLPECNKNTDPKLTAEDENEYFIKKIEKHVTSTSTTVTMSLLSKAEESTKIHVSNMTNDHSNLGLVILKPQ